jgi:ribosomal protein RSM22 (predicted rRNA methylase)
MNKTLKSHILKELCPDGIWQLTNVMKSVLRYQISRLPKNKVSEDETRYPNSPAGMRAFLVKFFTRHYLQTQNSLIAYMTSDDFLDIIRSGHLQILDIGSGPAVTSLAVTDTLVYILDYLKNIGEWSNIKKVRINYVLNDTSNICLGTGQSMLTSYFQTRRKNYRGVTHSRTVSISKSFPENLNQIQRIKFNLHPYDITTFSYITNVLNEDKGLRRLVDGILNIEKLCSPHGQILILQDKFQEKLMQRISKAIGILSNEEESTQQIYPKRNSSETYTYTYYSCLYAPNDKKIVRQGDVA